MNHTPGPWQGKGDGSGSINDSNGNQVALATLIGLSIRHPDERDANAHLIAAAPELLEEAQKAADQLCPPRRHKAAQENQTRATIHSATCKAHGLFAAIAKATKP